MCKGVHSHAGAPLALSAPERTGCVARQAQVWMCVRPTGPLVGEVFTASVIATGCARCQQLAHSARSDTPDCSQQAAAAQEGR